MKNNILVKCVLHRYEIVMVCERVNTYLNVLCIRKYVYVCTIKCIMINKCGALMMN